MIFLVVLHQRPHDIRLSSAGVIFTPKSSKALRIETFILRHSFSQETSWPTSCFQPLSERMAWIWHPILIEAGHVTQLVGAGTDHGSVVAWASWQSDLGINSSETMEVLHCQAQLSSRPGLSMQSLSLALDTVRLGDGFSKAGP